jgi:hypothetical protein
MIGQNVNIPDVNFKANLTLMKDLNTNGDDEIQISEAEAFTGTINCYGKSIKDFTGLEHFIKLRTLIAGGNPPTQIDFSKLVELDTISLSSSHLTSLDLSNNVKLRYINCHFSRLTELDFSKNVLLEDLHCGVNKLTYLNIQNGNNKNLKEFRVTHNDDLRCVQVDNAEDMKALHPPGSRWVDGTVSYSDYCEPNEVEEPVDTNTPTKANDSIHTVQTTYSYDAVEAVTTSIEEIESVNVNLYPNPTSSNLTIAINESIINIDIFNSTGSLVKSTVKKSFSVDSLSDGVYFIIITTNRGVVQKRFIKN